MGTLWYKTVCGVLKTTLCCLSLVVTVWNMCHSRFSYLVRCYLASTAAAFDHLANRDDLGGDNGASLISIAFGRGGVVGGDTSALSPTRGD